MDKEDLTASSEPNGETTSSASPKPPTNTAGQPVTLTNGQQASPSTRTPSVIDLAQQFNLQASVEGGSAARQEDTGLSPHILARRRARQRRRQARQRKQREQAVAANRAQRVFGSAVDASGEQDSGFSAGMDVGQADEVWSGMLERLERRLHGLQAEEFGEQLGENGIGRFSAAAAQFGLDDSGMSDEVWGEQGENDETMQRILAESYQSSKPASTTGDEDEDMRRAIEASLKEHAPMISTATTPGATPEEAVDLKDNDLLQELQGEDELARKLIEEGLAAEAKLEQQRRESEDEKMMLDVQLSSLRGVVEDDVVEETKRIFLEMRNEHKREGGRPPDFEVALSMAQDRAKDRKKQELREEQEIIEKRDNESRKARAKRFADALEKKLQTQKDA